MNRDAKGGVFQPSRLEVDGGIIDRNLQILTNSSSSLESEAEKLFLPPQPSLLTSGSAAGSDALLPSIDVTPDPGMCVKTTNLAGDKVFVNVCKINEIPPARPISEEQLQNIVAEENYATDFRIPMSLGAPRKETDKSGGPCQSCDVAVNTAWYEDTMENNLTFTTFLVHVAMEGLCEKYGDVANLDRQNWSILKNKKYMGKGQRHHIQQRASGNKIKEIYSGNMPMITEVSESIGGAKPKKPVQTSTSRSTTRAVAGEGRALTQASSGGGGAVVERTPKFKLTKEPQESENPDFLVAEIELPGTRSSRELTLDLGGDRIVVEARKCGYLLDVFIPFDIDQDGAGAEFHRENQVLTVTMPLVK